MMGGGIEVKDCIFMLFFKLFFWIFLGILILDLRFWDFKFEFGEYVGIILILFFEIKIWSILGLNRNDVLNIIRVKFFILGMYLICVLFILM